MAPGNADLIRPIYEEFGRGNFRLRFDVYHPHMQWGWSDEFPGLAGVYEDRRDPNPRLRSWLSAWEDWRVEVDQYLELGDHVVVLASYHGRGKGSGVEIHQQGAHVFELRDGKVVRFEIFADRERAIESARAAESRKSDQAPRLLVLALNDGRWLPRTAWIPSGKEPDPRCAGEPLCEGCHRLVHRERRG